MVTNIGSDMAKERSLILNRSAGHPFVVAGPCSAETEDQVMGTARSIHESVNLFRAGIWKPRTRPGEFEGVGPQGLSWLNRVQHEIGLPVATEVANAYHAELCLKHGIDVLWIGARTTVNPFSVQEIADAIVGTGIPVMVKNPISPDPKLWVGAIERIVKSGSKNVMAVHRGFSSMLANGFRNPPIWDVVIEMRSMMPDLPMICDPSHICGNTAGILSVAQRSIDLSFDGLMIEVHEDPTKALSDAGQQLTPSELKKLLGDLVMRKPTTKDVGAMAVLDSLRELIDAADAELIKMLGQRLRTVRRIAEHKRDNQLTIFQQGRWEEIIRSRSCQASGEGLDARFIEDLFRKIHQESIRNQTQIMNDGKAKELSAR